MLTNGWQWPLDGSTGHVPVYIKALCSSPFTLPLIVHLILTSHASHLTADASLLTPQLTLCSLSFFSSLFFSTPLSTSHAIIILHTLFVHFIRFLACACFRADIYHPRKGGLKKNSLTILATDLNSAMPASSTIGAIRKQT